MGESVSLRDEPPNWLSDTKCTHMHTNNKTGSGCTYIFVYLHTYCITIRMMKKRLSIWGGKEGVEGKGLVRD